MNKRQWIQEILAGNKDAPLPQHWMSFFNGNLARELTPQSCHYKPMWLYNAPKDFDSSAMGEAQLDKMISFNNYTGRCLACLGKFANISFGHGGPGEFMLRLVSRKENEIIAEYETGVLVKAQLKPHFTHAYNHPVKTIQDIEMLELPDPAAPQRYEGLKKDIEYLVSRGEYTTVSLNGFFSGLHYFLMDYEVTLMALAIEPELINAALDKLGNWNLKAAEMIINAGADSIALCDDLGSKQTLLLSPDYYRKFFKPWHSRLCDLAHSRGATVHLHSHGAITPLLDDLVECGFDFVNPFDPEEGFDIEKILDRYGDSFVVTGGFPASFWDWPFQRQREHLEYLTGAGRKKGRLMLMDSGGIPENVTKEQFDKILETSAELRGVRNFPGCV
ncbi:methylcobalamin:coenzyme M methyltransferase [Limihaloglobus sulfuriphilus]|uniref:Methylcobalamin:coenzyme M methyltransferase n=1 Tax=Limihaloglobus sulfuriphilus TaxID=1851148 RepID=A0A1Q2MBI9_9BACT|nr:uroporphyrinogen decarboxylase family protein [Limihaloglobus sulfuriphilus]AQQ69898.1 methylcobalamin:coenzyme M methyltransferase [Limihaloglobus sulfuriphilus]